MIYAGRTCLPYIRVPIMYRCLYAAFTSAGAKPAGLFAQTSMRVEKGFCAMGHELDSDVNPIATGLGFALRAKGGFIGAEALDALRAKGEQPRVFSLIFDDEQAVPLGHEPVYVDAKIVGQTSSCAFGYRVGKPVAIAHAGHSLPDGVRVKVDIARQLFDATVRIGPVFDPAGDRMKG